MRDKVTMELTALCFMLAVFRLRGKATGTPNHASNLKDQHLSSPCRHQSSVLHDWLSCTR